MDSGRKRGSREDTIAVPPGVGSFPKIGDVGSPYVQEPRNPAKYRRRTAGFKWVGPPGPTTSGRCGRKVREMEFLELPSPLEQFPVGYRVGSYTTDLMHGRRGRPGKH
jgi:hypothetical protein